HQRLCKSEQSVNAHHIHGASDALISFLRLEPTKVLHQVRWVQLYAGTIERVGFGVAVSLHEAQKGIQMRFGVRMYFYQFLTDSLSLRQHDVQRRCLVRPLINYCERPVAMVSVVDDAARTVAVGS